MRARQLTIVDRPTWSARADAHRARVDAWIVPHLERRQRHVKHPVEDFLFTYYSYSPARLRRWHPGVGVALAGAESLGAGYRTTPVGSTVDVEAVLGRRSESIAWIRGLLTATASRGAQLGCFGMHEWAMVYRQPGDQIRHPDRPLRLGPAGTDRVVEAGTIRCSHFDAYRFFTEPARPLNVLRPTRDTQVATEQPGCLHATMDLYKWAYTLSPLTSAELVADCFALARDVRALDMRASPYDLADLGYPPVRVETPDGRAEYVAAQRMFADRAAPLRAALLDVFSEC
ncbi:MAG: hypothetical protein QOE03_1236 [Micromonosporaceae bacterium]|nr:hypothetical protein [Micromonosporaceae bacterium]